MATSCPNENAFVALAEGALSKEEARILAEHLDSCSDCRILAGVAVRDLARATQLPQATVPATGLSVSTDAGAPTGGARFLLDPGTLVGRYIIERLIGAGGMGVVYLAHDPKLDRHVALKLIRPDVQLAPHTLEELLTKESKALARLSHPNVTTVYDVGSSPHGVFLALEYVDGTNLRRWLRERRRRPREILELFVASGEGLAAAHEAGLVHRDFKPDNVLVGMDGVAKVTDFGLARLLDGGNDSGAELSAAAPSSKANKTARAGTPAYMAPEQLRREQVDARADQFSFCAALFEALEGTRPFAGKSIDEIAEAMTSGVVSLPLSRLQIPARARRAILRGLSLTPERRFASMRELLADLAPRRGRPATFALAGALVTAALAIAGYLALGRPVALCSGAQAEADALFGPLRAERIRQAFVASGARNVEAIWTSVKQRIDEQLTSWTKMRTDACQATRLRGEQSEAVLDLRMACLERRRVETEALLSVLEKADAETVRGAMLAASTTGDVAPCADVQGLTAVAPLPKDEAARARLAGLDKELAQASALIGVGRYNDAAPLLTKLVETAKEVGYAPLTAESAIMLARVQERFGDLARAEESLILAFGAAVAGRADNLVTQSAIDMVYLLGFAQARFAEAHHWAQLAQAAIQREGESAALLPRVHHVIGALLAQEGKLPESEEMMRKALALAQRSQPGSIAEAEALGALGRSLATQGKIEEARGLFERALALNLKHYGPEHELTATVKMNLANTLADTGRHAEALPLYKEVLATYEAASGPDSVLVATPLSNLAGSEQNLGQLREAHLHASRALAIREKRLGREHPAVARALNAFADVLSAEGKYNEALQSYARAGAIVDRVYGPNHPERTSDLAGTGMALLAAKQYEKAIAPLERALRIEQESGGGPLYIGLEKSALGRALWDARRDRARAERLVAEAREALADLHHTKAVSEIDDWMRERSISLPRPH